MSTKKLLRLTFIFITGLFTTNTLLAENPPFPAQMTVNIYNAPTAAVALDKAYLIYELYLTSFMTMPVTLTSLDVKDGDKTIYTQDYTKESFVFKPKESKVIYMTVPFDALTDIPSTIKHQLTITGKFEDKQTNFPLVLPALAVDKTPALIVSAPLRGSNWIAGNLLSSETSHRMAALYFDGRPYYPERYAIDFVQVDSNDKTYKGDIHQNSSYYCYNQDILAVADGKIVAIQDGIAENIPNSNETAVQVNEKTLPGNYVIMDLGNKQFAGYAHLIPGSIKFKLGDFVKQGEVIAKLGNSGNSSEPHLHFQITDKALFLKSNGMPYGFDHFKVLPQKKEYRNQLPVNNSVVGFD